MPNKVKLQILYLMELYDKTGNQYFAECLEIIWKGVKKRREFAKELPSWRMKEVKSLVIDMLDLDPNEDINYFIQRTAPKFLNKNNQDLKIENKETKLLKSV